MDMEINNDSSGEASSANSKTALGAAFWNNQYKTNTTGWDLGQVSPPLKQYIDQLSNKNLRILIPGCGNTYEAEYLLQQGFANITIIDIAPDLVERLKIKFASNPNINIVLGDFFTHNGVYDLILEQTFFCAIDTALRISYVAKMKELLMVDGKLVGLLFNRVFEQKGPPYGGTKQEYIYLFEKDFQLKVMNDCHNSFVKRKNTELFIILQKNGSN
jgi:SAM-dependent methyltransferase